MKVAALITLLFVCVACSSAPRPIIEECGRTWFIFNTPNEENDLRHDTSLAAIDAAATRHAGVFAEPREQENCSEYADDDDMIVAACKRVECETHNAIRQGNQEACQALPIMSGHYIDHSYKFYQPQNYSVDLREICTFQIRLNNALLTSHCDDFPNEYANDTTYRLCVQQHNISIKS